MNLQIQEKTSKRFGKMRWFAGSDGYAWLNVEDCAHGLGLVFANGVIAWAEINRLLKSSGYGKEVASGDYIPENMFFKMAMDVKTPAATAFKDWVTDRVLPKIFKDGKYDVAEDDYVKAMVTHDKVRAASKAGNKAVKSSISRHIKLARRQGDRREDRIVYSTLARKANVTSGLPPRGGRDKAPTEKLAAVIIAESMEKEELDEGLARDRNYKDTELKIDGRLNDFSRILPKSFHGHFLK